MTSLNTTTRRPGPGFTVIELLVVIAIIAVISALVIGGAAALRDGAKESQARTILASLMGHAGQFESQFATAGVIEHLQVNDRTYFWGNTKRQNAEGFTGNALITGSDVAGDENGNDPTNDADMANANLYIERFIWAAYQMPVIRENLPSLGAAFGDFDNGGLGDGFLEVVDPWGNPIAYASRVEHLIGVNVEDDFLPIHDNPFFASAGKDQRWGRPRVRGEFANESAWLAYKDTDDYRFSVDNLYSYDIDRAAATRGD
jgi:prepilin-type N-terminal cleavage/methylation domain-containing protein